ncbi:MAG: betaine--homocysteine S-methyltransferase [Alphaproteobacteria bacterium]|nr:betaine--homocysteine S-methyltransferase [Alphaproteobacteria bacterium]
MTIKQTYKPTTDIHDLLKTKGFLLADGATGTTLFAMGLETGDSPELWNADHPDRVRKLHDGFIAAGSDIVLTNTFGGTRHRLKLHQLDGRVHELNKAAAHIARVAADEAGRPVIVAGSMGPTGELLEPLGALTEKDAVAAFTEQAVALAEGGVDVLWVETMSAPGEVRAAFEAARSTGLPVVATMTFDTAGRTMMGLEPEAYGAFWNEGGRPVAFGANCGIGPAELLHSVLGMRATAPEEAILVAKGNCGIPEYVDGGIRYRGSPEIMAAYALLARNAGARIIGGCCGTTAEHVAAMRNALDSNPYPDPDAAAPSLEEITEAFGKAPWASQSEDDGADGEGRGEDRGGARRRRRRRGA